MMTIDKVFIKKGAESFPLTVEILSRLDSSLPIEVVDSIAPWFERLVSMSKDPIFSGKKILYLTTFKGDFIKPCPCTRNVVCCNYYFLNLQTGCPIDCSYCILQEYLSRPFLTVYVNLEDMFARLDAFFRESKGPVRVGTGELTDSLAIDDITGVSSYLIPYFKAKRNAVLELKTKSLNIDNLLKIKDANGRVVISWSLNPESFCLENEKGASLPGERLEKAALCGKHGYSLSFHFDPIVHFEGWQAEYCELVRELFAKVDPGCVRWISLGSLRFSPKMFDIIKRRFPNSKITLSEMSVSFDKKMRYLFWLRVDMYRYIMKCIKKFGGNVPVYLCMESLSMYRELDLKLPQL